MLEKLQNLDTFGSIVVLNDFFLDRIIKISDIGKLYGQILEKGNLGGSIRGIPQSDIKGGNATNVAYALAKFGCNVSLITIGDKTSRLLLEESFSEFERASLFIINGKPGRTTALEFRNNGDIVNIMLSDIGDNESFGPEKLSKNEQAVLESAGAVIITNWASNKHGTELSKFAFEKSGNALHFLDPADIETRAEEFKNALSELNSKLASLFINENEFNILLKQYGLKPSVEIEEIEKLILELSREIQIPIDLHTSTAGYWSDGKKACTVKSFPTKSEIITGAGDVWDAANIVGYLTNLTPSERILLANAAASLYIGNPQGLPPTMKEVSNFVSDLK